MEGLRKLSTFYSPLFIYALTALFKKKKKKVHKNTLNTATIIGVPTLHFSQ